MVEDERIVMRYMVDLLFVDDGRQEPTLPYGISRGFRARESLQTFGEKRLNGNH